MTILISAVFHLKPFKIKGALSLCLFIFCRFLSNKDQHRFMKSGTRFLKRQQQTNIVVITSNKRINSIYK